MDIAKKTLLNSELVAIRDAGKVDEHINGTESLVDDIAAVDQFDT